MNTYTSIPYIVYNLSTGSILRTGFCPADMVILQGGENVAAVVGQGDTILHKVITNADGSTTIVQRTGAEIKIALGYTGDLPVVSAEELEAGGMSPDRAAQASANSISRVKAYLALERLKSNYK